MILLWSDWMASYNCLYSPTIYVCMLVSLKPVLRGRIWDKGGSVIVVETAQSRARVTRTREDVFSLGEEILVDVCFT
jgi:hypothetical protein